MTNLTNYHSHCLYCDGRANMEDFIRFAISEGFTSYGISSHAPLPFSTAWTMEWDRMDDYLSEFSRLKKKYAASDEKVYTVVTTVQVDDETEDEFTFLFKKPKAASYDRYVKTMSNSVTKASKSFAFDNIIDEQRDMLKETVEEYPAITISLADKLLRMLGLADTTSVKKL